MALIRFSFCSPPPPPHKNLKKSSLRTIRRASTLLALSVLIALATLLSLTTSAAAQTPAVDYDTNDDGYISVANLAQLNAIRHDLNGNGARDSITTTVWANYTSAFPNAATGMGCPATGCVGYELTQSLDFDSDSDGDVDANNHSGNYWDSGKGWLPIGNFSNRYTGDFKGNGNTINNLFINRTTSISSNGVGLFGGIGSASRIETIGITNANLTGQNYVGILVGISSGQVVACYTTGKTHSNNTASGGLVGYNGGIISTSYSTAYAVGNDSAGGLVGYQQSGSVTNSYATGRGSTTTGSFGGLIGTAISSPTVTASYWDTSTSGQTTSAGGSGAVGKTTRQLQTPTGYNGIYANWNANLDGVTGNDDPWTFGNKMQYPMLDYKMMSTTPQNSQAMGIPDNWNAPIVGERVAVCVTSATRSNRSGLWIWEKSANGDTWTALTNNSGASYEYYPVSADVGNYLRAKAPLSGGGFAYTRALGGRVKQTSAATAGSAISFVSGNTSPQVGQKIQASDPRPTGAVDARFSWQRCDNADTTYTDCSYIYGVWWTDYTPTTDDLNKYLRMVVYYETSGGVWTRHATAFTGQVAAASQ